MDRLVLLSDVNVLLYAFRRESPQHEQHKSWLEQALVGDEAFGVNDLVLSAVVRISTHPRVYQEPSSPHTALSFCEAVRSAPRSVQLQPGPQHWAVFARLVADHRCRGNAVPDAYLAALALEHGATWVTRDRDFARFRGLRVLDPLAEG
jgi:uncharacterized protein